MDPSKLDIRWTADTVNDSQALTVLIDQADAANPHFLDSANIWVENGDRWKCSPRYTWFGREAKQASADRTGYVAWMLPKPDQQDRARLKRAASSLYPESVEAGLMFEVRADPGEAEQVRMSYGHDFLTASGGMTGVACRLRLHPENQRSPQPSLPFPSVAVAHESAADTSVELSASVNHQARWQLAAVSPMAIQEPLQASPGRLEYVTKYVQRSQSDYVSSGPSMTFVNPEARDRSNAVFQVAVLVLGAWLGIVGGALSHLVLPKRRGQRNARESDSQQSEL
ncbi:hypothetical protein KNO15_03250 [Leifsonia shinshuensis]|uniref:hypothetical protein n=1 Tax=Leifsonia shinshuensis TaxID=150026 RepID=UPI001F5109BA|nr:hypothetical protein [Leifsonia shinshuensis]MCI0155712.1 hypothetical protein [Leifsonia shinshuensis]